MVLVLLISMEKQQLWCFKRKYYWKNERAP